MSTTTFAQIIDDVMFSYSVNSMTVSVAMVGMLFFGLGLGFLLGLFMFKQR